MESLGPLRRIPFISFKLPGPHPREGSDGMSSLYYSQLHDCGQISEQGMDGKKVIITDLQKNTQKLIKVGGRYPSRGASEAEVALTMAESLSLS